MDYEDDEQNELKDLKRQLVDLTKRIWKIEEKHSKKCPNCEGTGKINRWPYSPYDGNPYHSYGFNYGTSATWPKD